MKERTIIALFVGTFSLLSTLPALAAVPEFGTVIEGGLWAGAVDPQPVFCNGFESGDTGAWSSTVAGREAGGT